MCLRADRETAARITEEIGNLMKEIETLVEEKKKDSSDLTMMITPPDGKYCTQITSELRCWRDDGEFVPNSLMI